MCVFGGLDCGCVLQSENLAFVDGPQFKSHNNDIEDSMLRNLSTLAPLGTNRRHVTSNVCSMVLNLGRGSHVGRGTTSHIDPTCRCNAHAIFPGISSESLVNNFDRKPCRREALVPHVGLSPHGWHAKVQANGAHARSGVMAIDASGIEHWLVM